jgi:hypothetical protein
MNSDARSLEDDLSLLKVDVAVIRSNYVTKADLQEVRTEIADLRAELHKAINGQTWRLIGFASALVLASHFAASAGY